MRVFKFVRDGEERGREQRTEQNKCTPVSTHQEQASGVKRAAGRLAEVGENREARELW